VFSTIDKWLENQDVGDVGERVVEPLKRDKFRVSMSIHGYRRVRIWLDPGSLFLGEGADAAPEGATRGTRGTRAALEVVVISFGSPRWW
jgi:hypothetical protein